jgi:diguanylate cyclase (GGDEF)-like protein
LKYSLEQASHSSQHDDLTGLPNRTLFTDRLQRAILKAKRDKSFLALLFIDLDHLKEINDCYGHQSGDVVLKAIANRMIACIRGSDSLGRIGGDEFVVLLEDLSSQTSALEVARKIQAAVLTPIAILGREITTSVSIGIALYPDDAMTEDSLFKCADLAMYEAKQAGRNQIYLYSVAISPKA